jgi:hypothetical protein
MSAAMEICLLCGTEIPLWQRLCDPCRLREEGTTDKQLRTETAPAIRSKHFRIADGHIYREISTRSTGFAQRKP